MFAVVLVSFSRTNWSTLPEVQEMNTRRPVPPGEAVPDSCTSTGTVFALESILNVLKNVPCAAGEKTTPKLTWPPAGTLIMLGGNGPNIANGL